MNNVRADPYTPSNSAPSLRTRPHCSLMTPSILEPTTLFLRTGSLLVGLGGGCGVSGEEVVVGLRGWLERGGAFPFFLGRGNGVFSRWWWGVLVGRIH